MTAKNEPSADRPNTPLLLIDGSSYLYRAFHAMPNLTSAAGFPTGAIHGMVAMLTRLKADTSPVLAACVFDAKGKTFRDDLYPDYKANRASMPEPLAQQIAPIHEVVRLLGWPVIEVGGIEADDVIGTLAQAATAQGLSVLISTGDKDLAQLVNDQVSLINTMSNERLNIAGVTEKFGVPPDRIVDYLTLVGDSVDNVPGVDKVGPKTAVKLLQTYGSLDGVVAHADEVKGAVGENLRKALDWLPMGRRLVTVVTDADLSGAVSGWPQLQSLAMREPDPAALLDFYTRYDFRSMRRELEGRARGDRAEAQDQATKSPGPAHQPAAQLPSADTTPRSYETVLTLAQLDAWIEQIAAAPITALDTETDSLDPMRARMVGLSLAVSTTAAAYIPMAHDGPDAPAQLSVPTVLARLKPWLQDPKALKTGQNIKYDLHVFQNEGIQVQGYAHDTMLQSYVLDAHLSHALERLAERHLQRRGLSYEDVCGKGAHQIPFSQVDVARATQYSGEDSEMTLGVQQVLLPRIQADEGLNRIYRDIELPTSLILQRVERQGVLIDVPQLHTQSRELAERLSQLERQAYDLAGQPFNLGSPKQIGEVLFGKLGLPVKKKTASGAPSTDEEVLQELAADYPLPAALLEHRSLSKLKGTYTDKLPLMVNAQTGRVHTNYAQAVAVTGRLASNDPNLQNIPIRTPEGRRVRKAFIAPPGHALASADYSQIELRIMAHISEDPGLLAAFAAGVDVHRATASEVFGVPLDELSSEQRRYAKVINFGLIYGMGAFGLANNLGIEQKAARLYIERYFTRFAGVKRYMDETKKQAAERGYVQTFFGRRIALPEIQGGSGPRKAAAERQAINAPMQGTAADLIKLAMIAVQNAIDQERRATRIVMQVHDELVMEVPDAERDWVRERVPALMASVAQMKVPLVAEIGFGANWDEAH